MGFSDSQLFYKLIDSEDWRWMAFLHLNKWSFHEILKDSDRKLHPYLKPFHEFSTKELDENMIFDINSIRFISHYLLFVGYKLVKNH